MGTDSSRGDPLQVTPPRGHGAGVLRIDGRSDSVAGRADSAVIIGEPAEGPVLPHAGASVRDRRRASG